jgi:hypothetical protein
VIRLLPNLDDVGLRIRSWTRRGDQEKRVRSAQAKLESGVLAKGGLSKTHRDYWIQRIFKPTYSRHGATVAGRNWCVEIQHRGKRQRWSLGTPNKGAADRVRNIYLSIAARWLGRGFCRIQTENGRQETERYGARFTDRDPGDRRHKPKTPEKTTPAHSGRSSLT